MWRRVLESVARKCADDCCQLCLHDDAGMMETPWWKNKAITSFEPQTAEPKRKKEGSTSLHHIYIDHPWVRSPLVSISSSRFRDTWRSKWPSCAWINIPQTARQQPYQVCCPRRRSLGDILETITGRRGSLFSFMSSRWQLNWPLSKPQWQIYCLKYLLIFKTMAR